MEMLGTGLHRHVRGSSLTIGGLSSSSGSQHLRVPGVCDAPPPVVVKDSGCQGRSPEVSNFYAAVCPSSPLTCHWQFCFHSASYGCSLLPILMIDRTSVQFFLEPLAKTPHPGPSPVNQEASSVKSDW